MFILVAIVPVVLVGIFGLVLNSRREEGLRAAFVRTLVFAAAFVAVTTELMSLFAMLRFPVVLGCWELLLVGILCWRWNEFLDGAREAARRLRARVIAAPAFAAGAAIVASGVTLLLAVTSPPNTYDSMTYHMARVAHWAQDLSVAFFPTSILRQIYQPPLAEYFILHLQLLSGADWFANLVQWFAFLGCGAAASAIAREIGAGGRAQAYAFALVMLIPAAIVQASSTQNDLVVAFLIAAFYYCFLRAARTDERRDFVFAGLALGLAILCKGTAYLYCFPIGAYFAVVRFLEIDKAKRVRFAASVAIVLAIGVALNAPQYARNFRVFGSPVSTGDEAVANKNMNARKFAANVVRNVAMNVATDYDPLDKSVESWIKAVLGDEVKNPDSTWLDNEFAVAFSTHEDSAGNVLHFFLIVFALAAAMFVARERYVVGLIFTIIFGFALLSLLLKWQLWGARLQLPLFVLGTSLAALVIDRVSPRIFAPLTALALVLSATFLFYAAPRRVVAEKGGLAVFEPRRKQMFRNLPDLEPYFVDACAYIRAQNPSEVGLFLDFNDYEYPLWLMLKDDIRGFPVIRHVGVTNASSKLKSAAPPPELVITIRTERKIDGFDYEPVWSRDPVYVLKRK